MTGWDSFLSASGRFCSNNGLVMIEIIREGLITLTAPPLGTPPFVRKAPPVHIDTYALIYV